MTYKNNYRAIACLGLTRAEFNKDMFTATAKDEQLKGIDPLKPCIGQFLHGFGDGFGKISPYSKHSGFMLGFQGRSFITEIPERKSLILDGQYVRGDFEGKKNL